MMTLIMKLPTLVRRFVAPVSISLRKCFSNVVRLMGLPFGPRTMRQMAVCGMPSPVMISTLRRCSSVGSKRGRPLLVMAQSPVYVMLYTMRYDEFPRAISDLNWGIIADIQSAV